MFLGFSANSYAVQSGAVTRTYQPEIAQPWMVEAAFQFVVASSSVTPKIGPSIGYHLDSMNDVGVRTLLSTATGPDFGEYTAQAFWRHHLGEKTTSVYSEPAFGFNASGGNFYYNLGMALGVLHRINSDFSVGGSTGIDLSNSPLAAGKIASSIHLAPKLALLTSFSF